MNEINIKFKKGDITPGGYEVVEVRLKPIYKMRKRIATNNKVVDKEYRRKKGWEYSDDEWGVWYELDSFPNEMLRFNNIDIIY